MFQPQEITCTNCHHHGRIITEDIRFGSITVLSVSENAPFEIKIRVMCPNCHTVFDIEMKRFQTRENEMLFKCDSPPNSGLRMWRWLDNNGRLLIPKYRPNLAKRSTKDQTLDSLCKKISDTFVGWANNLSSDQSLDDLLGQVKDYTQSNSWKNIYKKRYIVAVCGDNSTNLTKAGFNGSFYSINYKNDSLINEFKKELGAGPEEYSKYYCCNKIGHCAEVHAANSLLYNIHTYSLGNLRFSIAYLIRNGEPRSYCMNCLGLFKLINV